MQSQDKGQAQAQAASILDGLVAASTSGTGSEGGSKFAGAESRKSSTVKGLGKVTVLGYGKIPAKFLTLLDASGTKRAQSIFGAQISQGVAFTASNRAGIQWSGYGEFSDYVGLIADRDGNLTIGHEGKISTGTGMIAAPALVKIIDVCEVKRGSKYAATENRTYRDADTAARHNKKGVTK